MRYPLLVSPLWRPLLLPFGATGDRAYVEVENGAVHVRFGFLFDHTFPLEDIETAGNAGWPLWAGIGWRTNFIGSVGLIGSYSNIVELRFHERHSVRMLLPLRCDRLYLSVEDPEAFIDAVSGKSSKPVKRPPPRRTRQPRSTKAARSNGAQSLRSRTKRG